MSCLGLVVGYIRKPKAVVNCTLVQRRPTKKKLWQLSSSDVSFSFLCTPIQPTNKKTYWSSIPKLKNVQNHTNHTNSYKSKSYKILLHLANVDFWKWVRAILPRWLPWCDWEPPKLPLEDQDDGYQVEDEYFTYKWVDISRRGYQKWRKGNDGSKTKQSPN